MKRNETSTRVSTPRLGYALPLLFVGLITLLAGCPALFNQPPVAIADGTPLSGEAPLTVSFDGSQSFDPDGTIATYEWDFDGDGTTDATGQTPSYEFQSQGTFQVVLTVTDNQGAKGTDALQVTIGQATIYFASDRDGGADFDLFRMDTGGGSQAQVTSTTDDEIFPNLLPNTRGKLAFSADRTTADLLDIFVSETDGSLPSNLTSAQTSSHEIQPSWSANGSKIAFASDQTNGDWEIFIMDADGTNVTQLTSQSGSLEIAPDISPDGKIAFVSDRDGDRAIWTMDLDGTNETKIIDGAGEDGGLGPDLGPAGLGIVGSNVGFGLSVPSWSPDGSQLAFTSDRDGGDFDIFIANADGSSVVQLTSSSAADYDPFWLPNGDEIAFVSDRDGTPQIFKVDVSTKAVTQLTSGGDQDVTPAGSEQP